MESVRMYRIIVICFLASLLSCSLLEASLEEEEEEGGIDFFDEQVYFDELNVLNDAPASSQRAKELEDDQEIINNFLSNEVDNEDLLRNVEAANKLLDQWPYKKVIRRPGDKNHWPHDKSVRIFMSLPEALKSCDYESYLILVENYLAAFGIRNGLEPETRVERIIQKCAKEHAKKCGPNYLPRFHEEYERLDKEIIMNLDAVLTADVLKIVHPDEPSQMSSREAAMKPIELMKASKMIIENIEKHSNLEKEGGEEDAIRKESMLLEACDQFTFKLRDIFIPMKFELGLNLAKYSDINAKQDELFEDAWIKNKICSFILSDEFKQMFNTK